MSLHNYGGVLPDHEIEAVAHDYDLVVPYSPDQLAPSSYDVRLESVIKVPVATAETIDLRKPVADQIEATEIDISERGIPLSPGQFVIGSTVEWVNIPDWLVCRIEGKSSLARVGLQIHSAGYIDPGYRGTITLEIVNFWPTAVRLWPDILIAQLSFEYLSGPCRQPYKGRYQNSNGAITSRYNSDGDKVSGDRQGS